MYISKKVLLSISLFIAFKAYSQDIKTYKFEEFENILKRNNDTTYIINFWATWCKPCIKEIPVFESVQKNFKGKVKVFLVSLDFVKDKDSKLKPFVEKNIKESKVLLLNDLNYNNWINKVDSKWEGAIPATLLVNNKRNKRLFIDKELKLEELTAIIESF